MKSRKRLLSRKDGASKRQLSRSTGLRIPHNLRDVVTGTVASHYSSRPYRPAPPPLKTAGCLTGSRGRIAAAFDRQEAARDGRHGKESGHPTEYTAGAQGQSWQGWAGRSIYLDSPAGEGQRIEVVTTKDKPRLLFDSFVIGVIGGLSAQLFMWMLGLSTRFFLGWMAGYYAPGLAVEGHSLHEVIGSHWLWLVPLVTTLGGVLSGILVYTWAPEAEGHGTDTAVKAVHWHEGKIRARVAPIKMIASAITIGSGGSAGREGPTALISAGFGSIYADLLHRSERERRMLVLMGMAAGLSAIFRSPIGTALFAVEVLYGGVEFEADALLYCMLASVVAYAVNGSFSGWHSLFQVPLQTGVRGVADYGWYALLGLASGVAGTILPEIFYRTRDAFNLLPVPTWIKPAIGGLLLGLMALELPQVLGGGYGWIQEAINGQLAWHLMLILLIAKMIAMAFTVSSGGSGGVFAPSLFVGCMLGGVFASLTHDPSAGMVVVGMAAVFAGAARVPIATLLMVAEMTGGYQLLVPAGLAVTLSYLLQTRLSRFCKYGSLYEGQVFGRMDSPAHRGDRIEMILRLLDEGKTSLPPEVIAAWGSVFGGSKNGDSSSDASEREEKTEKVAKTA